MKHPALIALVVLSALALTAPIAYAASYRAADVQRAVANAFKRGHGGGAASVRCAAVSGNTKWRCQVRRGKNERSTRFRLTIARRGAWRTGTFSFARFTGTYKLHGCCLRRR